MKRRSRLGWTTTVLCGVLATTAAAQVTVDDPLATLPVNGALPSLPNATGNCPDAATSVQTPFVVHEDQFTWAADLLTL